MKKILLSSILMINLALNAQTTIFEDSFESYTDFAISGVGNWTLTDLDLKTTYGFAAITFTNSGVAKSFQVFNSTATTPPLTPSATSNWAARTGNKAMVAFASGSAPWNNDWMISPQIQLGASNNVLTFWAKSCDVLYGAEKFKVLVSTNGTSTANFTALTPNLVSSPGDATYHQYTYNLDAYSNQNVFIAIQCLSQDQFGFMVDDFKVTTGGSLGTSEVVKKNEISISPNPTLDFLNINANEVKNVEIFDVSGKIINVKYTGNIVDVRNLVPGSYIITITTKDGIRKEKFIKK